MPAIGSLGISVRPSPAPSPSRDPIQFFLPGVQGAAQRLLPSPCHSALGGLWAHGRRRLWRVDHQRGGAGTSRPCLQGPPPAWLSPPLPEGGRSGGGRAHGCTARGWRALPCFTVWAGPGLIPLLPPGLSGAHAEADRGPAALGREAGRPSPPGLGRASVWGPVRHRPLQGGMVPRLCETDHPSSEGVSGGVWHPAPAPTKP